jgi:type I restriction enzyme, S subunit
MKFEVIEKNDLWQDSRWNSLPKTWSLLTVDDIKAPDKKSIISGPFGSNISSRFFVENGIPVIRGNNLSLNIGKKFIDDGFAYLTEDKANELNTWAKKDDLVFTAVGTIGQVGIITGREKFEKYIISNKQVRLTVNNERVLPLFAYYWFASDFMVEQIIQRNTGSSVPLINLSVLKSLIIPVPPLPEQKAIAAVLSSLDDKIDLLHRQNQTLEAMAETLFRQWFVVEAQEDWEEGTLGDVSVNVRDSVKVDSIQENCKYIGLEHIDRKNIALGQYGFGGDVSSNKYSFSENDILFGKLRPYFHKVCFAPFSGICSTDILVIRPIKQEWFAYCLFAFFQAEVVEFANIGSGGTRMPRTDWGTLKTYPIAIPDTDTVNRFNNLVLPSIEKIKFNLQQIHTLETLRDTLLPKLMSGEVRVSLTEKEFVSD